MRRIILISLLTLCCFAFLSADVYVKSNSHTDAFKMMGKESPAKDSTTEQWISKDKFATKMENQGIVVDLGKKKIYIIYHATKSYVEGNLPLDLSTLMPEQMKQMMGMMKMSLSVVPTSETKKIGDWNCKGFDLNFKGAMFNFTTRAWVTKDIPFDWKFFNENLYGAFIKSTMVGLEGDIMTEIKKIEGFTVASETKMSMMGTDMNSTTKVVELTEKAAPAGTYEVPAGYKKQDTISMKGMGK